MNRILKFRAWDKNNNCWFEDPKELINWTYNDLTPYSSDSLAWMQFIGLLDKNGAEIYEGDIVFSENYVGFVKLKTEVIFNRGRFCLNTGTIPEDLIPELCEIIGNIYENPELLTN